MPLVCGGVTHCACPQVPGSGRVSSRQPAHPGRLLCPSQPCRASTRCAPALHSGLGESALHMSQHWAVQCSAVQCSAVRCGHWWVTRLHDIPQATQQHPRLGTPLCVAPSVASMLRLLDVLDCAPLTTPAPLTVRVQRQITSAVVWRYDITSDEVAILVCCTG